MVRYVLIFNLHIAEDSPSLSPSSSSIGDNALIRTIRPHSTVLTTPLKSSSLQFVPIEIYADSSTGALCSGEAEAKLWLEQHVAAVVKQRIELGGGGDADSETTNAAVVEAVVVNLVGPDATESVNAIILAALENLNTRLLSNQTFYPQSETIYRVLYDGRGGGDTTTKTPLPIFPFVAHLRQSVIDELKYHMVTHETSAIREQLSVIEREVGVALDQQRLTCPGCGKRNLTPDTLWFHIPQYHINDSANTLAMDGTPPQCPVAGCCASGGSGRDSEANNQQPQQQTFRSMRHFEEHYYYAHCPESMVAHLTPSRPDMQLYSFALVVVRRPSMDNKFLLVQESKQRGWWLPGGGIDARESPIAGGIRETMEEAGVRVTIKGVLKFKVQPSNGYTRMWFIFYAEPEDDTDCDAKTMPDHESVGACWVSLEELMSGQLSMRGTEPMEYFRYVAEGGAIYPLSMLEVILGK